MFIKGEVLHSTFIIFYSHIWRYVIVCCVLGNIRNTESCALYDTLEYLLKLMILFRRVHNKQIFGFESFMLLLNQTQLDVGINRLGV